MKKILELRQIFDITLGTMLIGSLVFFFAFGSCLWIAREEAKQETDQMITRNIAYVQEYINGELGRVEDAAFTIASTTFGDIVRTEDGHSHVAINPETFQRPTPEECYQLLEGFLRANPHLSGVAVAFEPMVYPEITCENGFAPYVLRTGSQLMRVQIGEKFDYRETSWYKGAAESGNQCWTEPFEESALKRTVASFTVPLYGYGDLLIGVLVLDINVGDFQKRLRAAAPYEGAELVLLMDEAQAETYAQLPFHYVFTNKHSGGTYMLVCPEKEVYGGVKLMQEKILGIGIVSLLIMVVCFILLFRHMQKINMAKTSMESELNIASTLQMAMIPKLYPAFPERHDLDVYGYLRPAKTVGGDLYDYFIRDNKFFFAVGDVSGKGVPASLYMVVVRSLFRNITLHTDDPAQIATGLNMALSESNDTNMFCTMFLGVLDLATGHLDYCNAGHNAPVLRRHEEDEHLHVAYMKPRVNLALGLVPGFRYVGESLDFKSGEAMLLYTDGVTEAENPSKELFGEQAVLDCLRRARERQKIGTKDFVEHLVAAIDGHAAGADQSDDITILVVEYKG